MPVTTLCAQPDRIVLLGAPDFASDLAQDAVDLARSEMPKVTGQAAQSLAPIYGVGWFGIYFPERSVWFLERGTRPHTMRNLPTNKPIPMWIDDPTGTERKANPKSKTRTTVDGRTQVLIFRRVGVKKPRTAAQRNTGARVGAARYPGQAGRISRREAGSPLTTPGRRGGAIAKGNVGVAWRTPGTTGRQFLQRALEAKAADLNIEPRLFLADEATFYGLTRQ